MHFILIANMFERNDESNNIDRDLAMGIPNLKARMKIMEVMCHGYKLAPEIDFHNLAGLTPGFVGSDLKALITAAASFAEDRHYQQSELAFRYHNPFP